MTTANAVLSVRVTANERELLEAAAEQAHTSLSDFIRRKALEAAEMDLLDRRIVTIPAADWEKFEEWMNAPPKELTDALGARPGTVLGGRDYVAVFEREEEVAAIQPDFDAVARLDVQGVVVTAPGNACDFVSRYFAPAAGIPEDPVTGSTHCTLIPYWSHRLGKEELFAGQISARGGELFCRDRGDRVSIGG